MASRRPSSGNQAKVCATQCRNSTSEPLILVACGALANQQTDGLLSQDMLLLHVSAQSRRG